MTPGGANVGQAGQGNRMSGVTGTIAYASDGLLQVQDASSQWAVSYTSDTTIDARATGAVSDVKVGDCVTSVGGTSGTAATSVTVLPAAPSGECALGSAVGVGRGAGTGGFQAAGGPRAPRRGASHRSPGSRRIRMRPAAPAASAAPGSEDSHSARSPR